MKRVLFSTLTVILIGICLVSFKDGKVAHPKGATSPNEKFTNYYWFQITESPSIILTTPPLKAYAVYLGFGPTAPNGSGCSQFGDYQCVSGFAQYQVDYNSVTGKYELIDDNETPFVTPRRKATQ